MEQTELMEEMATMQRMLPLHLPLQGLQVHKVNVVRKVLTVLQDQVVQQVLQERVVLLDQRVRQDLQVAVQLERKVRQVPMERMEPMAVQAVQV
jgi:hypothetical protein